MTKIFWYKQTFSWRSKFRMACKIKADLTIRGGALMSSAIQKQ